MFLIHRLKVSIGHHEVCSTARPQVHGSVQWQESRISETFLYPSNVKQLPDIFVHLLRENDDPVCFTRFKPYDRAGNVRGFLRPAEWILLQEDKCIDALRDGQFPGQALIKIGFGPAEEAEMVAVKNEWDDAMIAMSTPLPHEVRVHLYQAKSLSATDAAGLSDPYVVVKIKVETDYDI